MKVNAGARNMDEAAVRAEVDKVVRERARLDTADKVCNARKDARMEALLLREYHGRFLIELLQNARDAWLLGGGARGGGMLRVRIASDRTLLVGNTGAFIDANVLLYSLCKTGESTKPPGDGIGHKGVGFKSVLEVSGRPEVYSRPDGAAEFTLRARFDREIAVRLVEALSPEWHSIAAKLPSHLASAHEAPAQRIPVFDFPSWCDTPPQVSAFARVGGRALNTVIALSHSDEHLSANEWVGRVREALGDLSDPVFALLDAFEQALVEDELAEGGPRTDILTARERSPARRVGDVSVRDVEVLRNGAPSSRWWLYTGRVPGTTRLDGEVAVGVRLAESGDVLRPVLIGEGPTPFHLFFPTQIPTGLPFLLHGYFEVDAGRKSFAEDAAAHNAARLDALTDLVVCAVVDLCAAEDAGRVDLASLADLFASSNADIENPRIRAFRDGVLARLDAVPWVRGSGGRRAPPTALLAIADDALDGAFRRAFVARYLWDRVGRAYPDGQRRVRAWLASRSGMSPAEMLPALLRPADLEPWDSATDGFPALLELLARLEASDPAVRWTLDRVIGDPQARVIPVVVEGGLARRSPPGAGSDDDADDDDRAPSWAAFARLRSTDGPPLVPPAALGLEFLPDGLVNEAQVRGMAGRLGVREYVTRDILRHVGRVATAGWGDAERAGLVSFLWRLLLRERQAEERVDAARLEQFEPGALAWCRPGRAGASPEERRTQGRAHRLARTLLPTREGTWHPAEELAFGGDWAAPFRRPGPEAWAQRAGAFEDNEILAPDARSLVAGPDFLRALLPVTPADVPWAAEHEALSEADETGRHTLLVFLFLQRLGVWEVPPVEFHASWRDTPPADTDLAPSGWWAEVVRASDGFTTRHGNVRIAENARPRWPLARGESAQVRAVARSRALFEAHGHATLFCNRCNQWNPKHRQTTQGRNIPSTLAWRLRTEPWVPVHIEGAQADPVPASTAWFEPDAPSGPQLRQSWLRFLPLADRSVDERLARWLGCPGRDGASVDQVAMALGALRARHEHGPIWEDDRDRAPARQAFIAAHVRLYELLRDRPRHEVARVVERIGVLAEVGTRMEWVRPTEARHDDGRFASYRRHFSGRLAFLAVPRRATYLADVLGVPRFEVRFERVPMPAEEAEPPAAPAWLGEALPDLLAMLAYVSVGGVPVTVGSKEFLQRARRLSALRVGWVSDLVQRVTVVGRDDLARTVGEAESGDVFLAGATTALPVLLHDFDRREAPERLRAHLGAAVGAVLESPGHADTFALYFQLAESARGGFLLDRGIGTEELAMVRQELQRAGLVAREEERRWWSAVLAALGEDSPLPDADDALSAFVVDVLRRRVAAGAAERLIRAGGELDVRADTRPEGALATLEALGVDLRALHTALLARGDEGLDVRKARDLLRQWVAAHGHLAAAALQQRGRPEDAAKAAPGRWRVPPAVEWSIAPLLQDVLSHVGADLAESGMDADPAALASTPVEELARLAELTIDGLRTAAAALFAAEGAAERARALVHRWRAALIPILVAVRTRPDDWGSRIRHEESLVSAGLPSPPQVVGLIDPVLALAGDDPAAGPLADALRAGQREQAPPGDLVGGLPPGHPTPEHLERVRREIDGVRRRRFVELRKDRDRLREVGVAPTAPPGLRPPAVTKRTPQGPRDVPLGSVRRNQRRLDELGRSGERWALAGLIEPILALGPDDRRLTVAKLLDAVKVAYRGAAVVRLEGHAAAARATADDDDEFVLALLDLTHLSATSDHFGCDALAWLPPAAGEAPCPLFVEIKNDADHAFPVSVNEWAEARRLGDSYAFLVVQRGDGPDAPPRAMDLLVNPAALHGTMLTLEPDGHIVRYRPTRAG